MTDSIPTVSGTEEVCGTDSTNLNRNDPNAPYGCSNTDDISVQRNSDDKNSTLVEYAINQVNKPLAAKTVRNKSIII